MGLCFWLPLFSQFYTSVLPKAVSSLSIYILVYVHVGIDAAVGISGGTIAVEEADLHAKLLPTKLLLAQMGINSLRCIK